jgi:hypothetical protein
VTIKSIRRRYPKMLIILDFQDGWVVPELLKLNSLKAFRSRRIERKSIMQSNRIAFATPSMKSVYDEYYHIHIKTKLVLNGYVATSQDDDRASKTGDSEILRIGYFGKIHIGNKDYFRDVRKIFDYFDKSDHDFKKRFQFDIYGYFSGDYSQWLDRVPFNYLGVIDHNSVQEKMSDYDFLMLFHSEEERAEEVLTGKVFEYLYARKPVLVIGTKNMYDARTLIEGNKLGIFIDIDNDHDMTTKLNYIHKLKKDNLMHEIYDQEYDVSQYDRKYINNLYAEDILQLCTE